MEQSKYPTEASAQGQAVYYQPQGPAPPPGYYGQPPPGQQQPYVVVQQPQPQPTVVVMGTPRGKSFVVHMVLACCTFWCCGVVFGIVAFIIALIAHNTSAQSPQNADLLGKISVVISVLGIILGIIVIIYYIVTFVAVSQELYNAFVSFNGTWTFTSEGSLGANKTEPYNSTRVY